MQFLAMHIVNQKLSFDIFIVQNIFMEHDLFDFWHKRKSNNFDPYKLFLAIANINKLQRLMPGFVSYIVNSENQVI